MNLAYKGLGDIASPHSRAFNTIPSACIALHLLDGCCIKNHVISFQIFRVQKIYAILSKEKEYLEFVSKYPIRICIVHEWTKFDLLLLQNILNCMSKGENFIGLGVVL